MNKYPNKIYSDVIYNEFSFIEERSNKVLWSLRQPLSGNLAAGIITAFWNIQSSFKDSYLIKITSPINNIELYTDDVDAFERVLSHYIVYSMVDTKNDHTYHMIDHYTREAFGIIKPQYPLKIYTEYGIWIYDNFLNNRYETATLYVFDSLEFIRGFISICIAFRINYNSLIATNVLRPSNGRILQYAIQI